ncbi:Cyclodipeptide synthase [Gracilaria domingensis]|nr:Cyclodipeptide synthase [Gracilaria domingensis]
MLNQPGVFLTISVLVNSPLKEPSGAHRVVAYLQSLPYPSVVLVVDSPVRHDIIAIKRRRKDHEICPNEAHRMALERGSLYVKAISDAIIATGSDKITLLRWDDIIDENKAKQAAIVHEYYYRNPSFRHRVDEIGMEFVNQRIPNSRFVSRRTSHAVKFILDELPLFLTGLSHKNERYVTRIYATSTISLARANANPDAPTMRRLAKDIHSNLIFSDLKKKLVEADDGIEAHNGLAILAIEPQPAEVMAGV